MNVTKRSQSPKSHNHQKGFDLLYYHENECTYISAINKLHFQTYCKSVRNIKGLGHAFSSICFLYGAKWSVCMQCMQRQFKNNQMK